MYKRAIFSSPLLLFLLKYIAIAALLLIPYFLVVWKFTPLREGVANFYKSVDHRHNNVSREEEAKYKCEKEFITEHMFLLVCSMFTVISTLPLVVTFVFFCQYKVLLQKYDMRVMSIDDGLVAKFGELRKDHKSLKIAQLREEIKSEVTELLNEKSWILRDLDHASLLPQPIPDDTFRTNLNDFIFRVFHPGFLEKHNAQFLPTTFRIMISFMSDLLKGVQYLHDQRIYHLNLQPKNILVLQAMRTEMGHIVKIGGFTCAKRIEDKKVSTRDVGLDKYKRPPECFQGDGTHLIDAEKFDCWSVGITAFELFTGGMMTVESDLKLPDIGNFNEMISIANVLDQTYFASAMDSRWDFQSFFRAHRSYNNNNEMNFTRECYKFVQGLMKFEPRLRLSMERALHTAFMETTWEKRRRVLDILWA